MAAVLLTVLAAAGGFLLSLITNEIGEPGIGDGSARRPDGGAVDRGS